MDLIYIAHPVAPRGTETVDSNLNDAEWWLAALQRANPGVAIIAPWIQEIRLGVGDEAAAEDRARGLARCRAAAERCDAIVLCGPRISTGVLGELKAVGSRRRPVAHRFSDRGQDLALPPSHRLLSCDFAEVVPVWLHRFTFGSCPQSVELVGAEILAAIEREAVMQ